jgi:hypothetical protein
VIKMSKINANERAAPLPEEPPQSEVTKHASARAGASVAQPKGERHHVYPARLAVQPLPDKPHHWLATVDELAPFPIRRTKLVRWRKFRNVARYRLGVEFPESAPDDWSAMVVAAEAEGGAA